MKIDFKQQLTNKLTGNPIYKDETGKEGVDLSYICVEALLATIQGEQIDGNKKLELWNLANKIHNSEVDLTVEEVALIKERVGKVFSQLIVGTVYDALE